VPEGHLIHRAAREHHELFAGHRLRAVSPQGRFRDGAAAVNERRLEVAEAHGKHLLYRFEGATWVHVHLGMRGLWLTFLPPPPQPKPQVRLRLEGEHGAVDLIAPARCDLLHAGQREELLAKLGPDPLRGDDPGATLQALSRSAQAIGSALLDQALFAGCGNVLRNEVLADLRIAPQTPSRDLGEAGLRQVWDHLTVLMVEAMQAGVIKPSGRLVYKQEACARCGTPVGSFDLGGRTAYACPACQGVTAETHAG
jgi:endonuclease VIII